MGSRVVSKELDGHQGLGFTLLETMWAVFFLTIAALALMALASHAIRAHHRVLDSRITSVRVWNEAADFLASGQNGGKFEPIPGRRPMARLVISNGYGRRWEVLRAGK